MQNRSRDQSAVWSIHHFETVKDPNEIKVLTIYKYPNRIFLKTEKNPFIGNQIYTGGV